MKKNAKLDNFLTKAYLTTLEPYVISKCKDRTFLIFLMKDNVAKENDLSALKTKIFAIKAIRKILSH